MARFEDLPNEVLLQLPLQTEDLLSTVLLNRRLRKLHSMLLYSKVEINGEQPGSADRLVCFLRTIVSNPQLASAVHELYLMKWTREIIEGTAIHIDQTIACSPRENERSSYRRGRNHINLLRDEIASFLASNLPNLSTINLQFENRFISIADAVTPKLTMITLRKDSYGVDYKIPMREALHFLSLPTLSAFSAPAGVESSDSEDMVQQLHPSATSKVRTLQLNIDDMSEAIFLAIMNYPPTLTKLYLLRTLSSVCASPKGSHLDCSTVTQAIYRFKHNLEVLTLFKTKPIACYCGTDLLGSLRTFSSLRKLKINPELLVRGSLESVSTYNLCYLLPSTLKRLTLYIDHFCHSPNCNYWARLVTELASRNLQPELEVIELDFNLNPRRMTCMRCKWSVVYCNQCDEDAGIICTLCYRSAYVEKLSAICKAANIELRGSWHEHVTDHPLDHSPSFFYNLAVTDE